MMNSHHFGPTDLAQTFLRARGFDRKGNKSGGIIDPRQVTMPSGTILIRTYQEPAGILGDWWFTPYEMGLILDHFGRDGSAIGTGRREGKGILPAAMGVREEWGRHTPRPLGMMGYMTVLRSKEPLLAFMGESDVAPDSAFKHVLKPIRIMEGGRQRLARQLFLPDFATYQNAAAILDRHLPTDENLASACRRYGSEPQAFER